MSEYQVICSALEKSIKMVKELELRLMSLESTVRDLQDQINTPQTLHEYLVDESRQSSLEIPLTPSEIASLQKNYRDGYINRL